MKKAAARLLGAGVKLNVEGIKCAQHKRKLGARMAVLDLDDPLAADADALGESRLIELELPAPVADDGAEVGSSANEHAFAYVIVRRH